MCKLELDLGDEVDGQKVDKTMCALLGSLFVLVLESLVWSGYWPLVALTETETG